MRNLRPLFSCHLPHRYYIWSQMFSVTSFRWETMSGKFLEVGVKSEKFCLAPPFLVSVWWIVWSFWTYISKLRDPKDVLYKVIELACSFSDLQKLTFFGFASRLQAKIQAPQKDSLCTPKKENTEKIKKNTTPIFLYLTPAPFISRVIRSQLGDIEAGLSESMCSR
jgi:hypothetical protein